MNFNDLIKSNKENVKNIIKLITKEENEDIEQEVYIKVWKNSDKYQERGSFKSWISTITRNLCKDYLKSAYFKNLNNSTSDEYVLVSVKDKHQTPEDRTSNRDRHELIINAIESLKPKFKEVIILAEIQGYTYEEISKRLRCPLGTVKSRIYNAKKELAQKLEVLL